jgi:hypothetical protein
VAIKGGYLLLAGVGGIFVWSGIKGKSVTGVARQLIGGDSPANAASANTVLGTASTTGSGTEPVISDIPGGGGTPAENQALCKLLLVGSHPDWAVGQEWSDLVSLWNQESGWSQTAQNPSSGAYGIPQALPYTKMPKSAWPPSDGGSSNPGSQMSWGLSYIASVYGSPSAAWAHEQAYTWY